MSAYTTFSSVPNMAGNLLSSALSLVCFSHLLLTSSSHVFSLTAAWYAIFKFFSKSCVQCLCLDLFADVIDMKFIALEF